MTRQQRTSYIRQTLPTVSTEALYSLLWTIDSTSGSTLELRVTGMMEGMVFSGFPPLTALNSGRVAVSAEFLPSDEPAVYNTLRVEFDGVLNTADLYTLAQPSQCLRNRWGGVLSAGKQAFPTPFVFANEIVMTYGANSPNQLYVEFLSQFLPVCIGPTPIIENTANGNLGTFVGWLGLQAVFDFPQALSSGDLITWPGNQDSFKDQFGGVLRGDSFVIP